jgi:protein ImuB
MVGALYLLGGSTDDVLVVAHEFTPRIEICGPGDLLLDLSGLSRLFGDPRALAQELQRAATARGLDVAVAVAGTGTAARLLARSRQPAVGSGQTRTENALPPTAYRLLPAPVIVVNPGTEAATVAPLPLTLLSEIANDEPGTLAPLHHFDLLSTFQRWGLRTLGDLAALPADEIAARLGTDGLRWHRLAEGRDLRPLHVVVPEERFEQALDLEWPIDALEPLSFVLARLLEPLSAHLERRGRGAAVLHLRLHLVTRAVYERSLELPAPMRDARTLRTLLLLDLESHPAPAAIDRVVVTVEPTPARVLQFSLLQRPLPSPEQLSTLMARLSALMGEGRCGSPAEANSWRPGAFVTTPFNPGSGIRDPGSERRPEPERRIEPRTTSPRIPDPRSPIPALALRRFRFPVATRVRVENDRPIRVSIDRRGWSGGHVERYAGPWRTSGGWWNNRVGQLPTSNAQCPTSLGIGILGVGSCPAWDRDEWDVTLGDGATYRIFRDRATGAWFLEGIYD